MAVSGSNKSTYLIVEINEYRFGLSVSKISGIRPHPAGRPESQLGRVLSFFQDASGKNIPILNSASRLGMGAAKITNKSCIVFIECNHDGLERLGLLVDKAVGLMDQVKDNVTHSLKNGHTQPTGTGVEGLETHSLPKFLQAYSERVEESRFGPVILLKIDALLDPETIARMRDG